MRDNVVFKRGQVICFTTGDYSDYMIESYFRVLRGFDRDWARKEYLATQFGIASEQEGKTATTGKYFRLNLSAFLVWLKQAGFVKELEETRKPVEWNFDEDCYAYPIEGENHYA